MPAVYAHECFGRAVAAQLDGEVAEVIRKYDASFQIGLQGPDIFSFSGRTRTTRLCGSESTCTMYRPRRFLQMHLA